MQIMQQLESEIPRQSIDVVVEDQRTATISSCMCGRYRLSRRKQIIEEYFETADWQDDWSPRYNIAPTQPVPVIRQHPQLCAVLSPYYGVDQAVIHSMTEL
jgi:hypothetical protein